MIEIKSRYDGRVLYTAKNATDVRAAVIEAAASRANLSRADLSRADLYGANLSGANLSRADLSRANLSRADLFGANLFGANLFGANLFRADLSRADLYGANLSGANLSRADLFRANLFRANLSRADLSGATGVNKHLTTPLYMLLDQPGKQRAYKLVNAAGEGPVRGGIRYEVGKSVAVDNASADEQVHCAAGINVATLDWCIREWRQGYRILVVEYTAKDIAAIPVRSDGKFRLHRCKVVDEKDLFQLGLVEMQLRAES